MNSRRLAFYDFDGTLASSDVVDQYLWYVRRGKNPWRLARLIWRARELKRADRESRELFNRLFYSEYRGWPEAWLRGEAKNLFERYLRPHLHEGVELLLEGNRNQGFVNVLVTGGLDFAMAPVCDRLGFEHVCANRLEFEGGQATGRLLPPVLAGASKVEAMLDLCRRYNVEPMSCRAYSDDIADLPMLEAVGEPFATNPKPELKRIAEQNGWMVLAPPFGRRA